jgi:hypothetical protein
MKKHLLALIFALLPLTLWAHEHADIRITTGKLVINGPSAAIATYFPLGEAPSNNLPDFPGGTYASELTFSAFDLTSPPGNGALVRMDLVSVTGPAGGSFSFWEAGATAPTLTRATGWTAGGADQPSFFVSEDGSGYGHIHGRVFTMSKPGVYQVTFRAVDTTGHYTTSNAFVVQFTVLQTPQLTISKVSGNIRLTFTSRADLVYDIQSSTSLQANDWETIGDPLDGTGGALQFTESMAGRPRVFYRLVEYQ